MIITHSEMSTIYFQVSFNEDTSFNKDYFNKDFFNKDTLNKDTSFGKEIKLYYTTDKFIHEFYRISEILRIVNFPTTNLSIAKIPTMNLWRVNRLVHTKTYNLRDPKIYKELGIQTPSIGLCGERGYTDMVQYLVNNGDSVHEENDYAIRWASRNGYYETVKCLIEFGADIHADNEYALRWSSFRGHLNIVELLVSKGADVSADNNFAYKWSAYNGHIDVLRLLHSKTTIDLSNGYILFSCALLGTIETVRFIIENGAPVDKYIFKYLGKDKQKYLVSISNNQNNI